MTTIAVTDDNFEELVLNSDKPVLLDFWAQWCGPCKSIGPILEDMSTEREDVIIAKMDIDDNPNTPTKYGVRSIPTMLVFKSGEELARTTGAKPKSQLAAWLDQSL